MATDKAMNMILNAANKYLIKVCFHHEPYEGRSPQSVKEDLQYIIDTYGSHPAFFRWTEYGNRPLFFVYDSYIINSNEWKSILSENGGNSIRGTSIDSIMIGLYVDSKDIQLISEGHFDGSYTYFATDGFTVGSTLSNWPQISSWSKINNKIFIPSLGPGYDDTRIRPWNSKNKRERMEGAYYDHGWKSAISLNPSMISITSFNEWHEGTQIEPAIPKDIPGYSYSDYLPLEPDHYLSRTKFWVNSYDPS